MDELRTLMALPAERWAGYMLAGSPAGRHLGEDLDAWVRFALQKGRDAAARHGGKPVWQACAERGIAPVQCDDAGSMLLGESRFEKGGPVIVLYQAQLRQVREKAAALLGPAWAERVEPTVLAHELFHCMEATDADIGLNRHRLTTFRLGRIRLRSRVRALSEIGAMAFACATGGWQANPLALDYLLWLCHDPATALRLAQQMLAFRDSNQLTTETRTKLCLSTKN